MIDTDQQKASLFSYSPGEEKELNWLPAPGEGFFLMMRLDQPERRASSGEYIVSPVQKVS
jgi:hypothetical protein